MKASDTVKSAYDLCLLTCNEYRILTLSGKNCDGLDCEVCQLQKQAEITWVACMKEIVEWIEKQNLKVSTVKSLLESPLWQSKLEEWGDIKCRIISTQ